MSKNDDEFEFSLSNHYLTSGNSSLSEPPERNCQDIISFHPIDPLTESVHLPERTLLDEEVQLNNLFVDSNIYNSLHLQSSSIFDDNDFIVQNSTEKTNYSETRFLDQYDIKPGEINASNFVVNPPQSNPITQPKANNDQRLEILNLKIIKNEDEVNSSPQILNKASLKKNDQYLYIPFILKCKPPRAPKIDLIKRNNRSTIGRRKNFTDDQKKVMVDFIEKHKDNPYIDNASIVRISEQTGLTNKQIRIFMTNYRVRNDCSQKRRTHKPLSLLKEISPTLLI